MPSVPSKPKRQRAVARVSLRLDRSGGANPDDAAGANINTIVAQYKKHGTLPRVSERNPLYGDFTHSTEIHDIREAVHQAEDRFAELPAEIRTMCDNDWVTFLEKFQIPSEREKLAAAGLQINNNPPEPVTPPSPTATEPTPTPPEPAPTATNPVPNP